MFNVDAMLIGFDRALRVISGQTQASRPNPSSALEAISLTPQEQQLSAALMRVNHVGEVCAQALYDSQTLGTTSNKLKQQFIHSGIEEQDHLAWTAQRLIALNSRPSLLNPIWYLGAYTCGIVAAKSGDQRSLGFVVETERQVEAHLSSHLAQLPAADTHSRAIVEQMRLDEIAHGSAAQKLGAKEVPAPVQSIMKIMAKVMTTTAYYI